ncbi:DUF6263 family protein [Olivibacter sitiensis]|uniref:DUF6263 family protein n=1 Tax=Olivibacter sitiensis TaxID=376470 RepID=UPI000418A502|nr:DUF6263 family protein [Olivibacter sitiensis]
MNVIYSLRSFFVFVVIVSLPQWMLAQSSVDLKLRIKPQDKFSVEQKLVQEIKQVAMGQEVNIIQNSKISYDYDVLAANAEEIVIRSTFRSIQLDMTTPQGNLSIDSEQDIDSVNPLKPVGEMVGKSFSIYLSPKGEVNKVEGFTSMFEQMDNEATKNMIEQMFNDELMAKSFEAIFKIYPSGSVKKGDSWNSTISATTGGMFITTSENTYTLYDLANDHATINVQSDVRIAPAGNGKMMGMDMEYDLKGIQTGKIVVDVNTGMASDFTIEQLISGAIKAQGMTIPVTIKTNNDVQAKKL